MPWLSHTFLLVHPKYHVEKLSITSHSAGKCAALETFYDKSLWKSCSLVVKALMCQQLAHHCVLPLKVKVVHIMMLCYVIQKSQFVWRLTVCQSCQIPFLREKRERKKSFSVDPRLSHLTALWSIPSSYSAWMSSRICGNWGWYRALEKLKLMVFTPRFIT